jgi:hypothetical protein
MLRHSVGYALSNKGHDFRLLHDFMGHRDPRHTTAARRFEGGNDHPPHALQFRQRGLCFWCSLVERPDIGPNKRRLVSKDKSSVECSLHFLAIAVCLRKDQAVLLPGQPARVLNNDRFGPK